MAITAPRVPVVANVTAEPTQDPARIRALLIEQVTATVRWEESVQAIAGRGVTRAYELGSGSVLRGLVKRTACVSFVGLRARLEDVIVLTIRLAQPL